jgi:hypothetical protein
MQSMRWDDMATRDRTKQYDRWVERSDVGEIIGRFNGDPRHWIKDGPVKEWARAKIGLKPYGHLVGGDGHDPEKERTTHAQKIVRQVLPGWGVDPDSISEKPMRLTAVPPEADHDETPHVVAWAEEPGFKNLLWAALVAMDSGDPRPWILAVTGTFEKPVSADRRAFCARVGDRCGVQVVHVEL